MTLFGRLLPAILVLHGFHGPLAQATSFIERSFPDTVQDAPIIVRGTVGTSYSDWARGNDRSKRIYTFYELQPSEVFKGALPEGSIIVRELGGSKDGNTMEVPGTAHFSRGEEVVLMLSPRNPDGSFDMRGMMMGKYNLKQKDGKDYVVGPGVISPEDARDGQVVHPGESPARPSVAVYSLEDLRHLARGEALTPSTGATDSPDKTASATRPNGVSPSATPTAPRLQPQETENTSTLEASAESESSSWRLWVAVAIAGLLILRRIFKRRR